MRTEFVSFSCPDGVKLQGLFFEAESKSKTVVIHVHGLAGNFYENSFIPIIASKYCNMGVSFFAFNNRGHDYISDCVQLLSSGEYKSFLAGAAYEVFEDSILDIFGAFNYAISAGYDKVILQGHSSGANKVVHAVFKNAVNPQGIILLSPCDDVGLLINEIGDEVKTYQTLAAKYILEGAEEKLMPEGAFFEYLMSAKTFAECCHEGSALDVFPYRDQQADFKEFSSINIPILVTFGGNGDYVLQDLDEVHRILDEKKSSAADLSFAVIKNGPHSYSGAEEELAEVICSWVQNT